MKAPRPSSALAPTRWSGLTIALLLACGGRESAPEVQPEGAPPEPPVETAPTPPPAEPVPATPLPDFTDPSWRTVDSRAGTYRLHWRTPAGTIPRNQDFTLEVWVLRDGALARGTVLDVHAWMPDHGHGMLRKTRTVAQPDGSFRIEGMLLHMRGRWNVFFDLMEGTIAETAECAIEL